MHRPAFDEHLKATTLSGSNKGTSYLRALDLLQEMLATNSLGFNDCLSLWQISNVERLYALQEQVREEQQAGDKSVWNLDHLPKSYLQNGYCSAALTSYIDFLVEYNHSSALLEVFESCEGSEDEIVAKLDQPIHYPESMLVDLSEAEGRDAVRQVKTRVNQKVFRDIILKIYEQRCCLTGLDVPEVIRASFDAGLVGAVAHVKEALGARCFGIAQSRPADHQTATDRAERVAAEHRENRVGQLGPGLHVDVGQRLHG